MNYMNGQKYPRTYHLPWSLGTTSDDKTLSSIEHFIGKKVVVTEKLDGENFTLSHSCCHARSVDSVNHESRTWLKQFWGSIKTDIPTSIKIHGESMFAQHSIFYSELPSYFIAFGVTENQKFLSWDETQFYCESLGIVTAPVLYTGVFDEDVVKGLFTGKSCYGDTQEGYVVRMYDGFDVTDFKSNVAKFVRKNHVQTSQHWMYQKITKNTLVL